MSELTLAGFDAHPNVKIYRSLPAIDGILGARMLSEIGDDLHRFPPFATHARTPGTPVTRSSGLWQVTYPGTCATADSAAAPTTGLCPNAGSSMCRPISRSAACR
jgi:hypothetical protein